MRASSWLLAALSVLKLLAAPATADVTDADRKVLAVMALQWALDGGINDVSLLKDRAHVIAASLNLPADADLNLANTKVTVLRPADIKARADAEGDFLYFRFGAFRSTEQGASVHLALLWAVSARSKAHYLSGGGATLEFEKRDDKWELLPVTDRWMS